MNPDDSQYNWDYVNVLNQLKQVDHLKSLLLDWINWADGASIHGLTLRERTKDALKTSEELRVPTGRGALYAINQAAQANERSL